MSWNKGTRLLPAGLITAGLLACAPAWGANTTARPGTINYVEGRVLLDGQALSRQSIGTAELDPGQVLDTQQGKAELLLTPGVFLRIGDNSEVRMINPGLTHTSVAVTHGEALLEVTMLLKENHLQIADAGTQTTILKDGLYRFTADNNPSVSVIEGKADLLKGDRNIKVNKDHELLIAQASDKPQKFDKATEDDLYAWSKVRSEYMAQANAANVQTVIAGGMPWWGPGWYWSPWYDMYAFMPGYAFWGPFGYPFYSPFYNPWYYGGVVVGGRYYAGHAWWNHATTPAVGSSAVIGHRIASGDLRSAAGFRSGQRMSMLAPSMGVNNGFGRVGAGIEGFHGGFAGRR